MVNITHREIVDAKEDLQRLVSAAQDEIDFAFQLRELVRKHANAYAYVLPTLAERLEPMAMDAIIHTLAEVIVEEAENRA